MMKKKRDKSDLLNMISIFICLGCMVVSIANIWIKEDFITTIIWIFLLISMTLNWHSETLRSFKYSNKYIQKQSECFDYIWALEDMKLKILTIDIPEDKQKELIDWIEEHMEEICAHRENLAKQLNLKERE